MSGLRFRKGDLARSIVLPDVSGELISLAHPSIAGHALVLWFVHGSLDRLAAERLAAQLDVFESVETKLFTVAVGDTSSSMLDAVEAAGLPLLVDPDGRVAKAFGASRADTFIVLDAGARVAAMLPDSDAALATCTALFHSSTPIVADGHAPVLLLEDLLEPEFCLALIKMWDSGQKIDNNVATAGDQHADSTIKRRSDVYVDDRATYEAFAERMRKRVYPEVRRAFQTKMVSFEVPRIGCYDAGNAGYFARHRDNTTPFTAHRLFAMTINLNTGAYEGGDLRFAEYGRQLYRPPVGGAVIFSCSLLHEAMPVTAGRRFGVFSFLTDATGAQRERELIKTEEARGQRGIVLS